jgi:hypothetical protein
MCAAALKAVPRFQRVAAQLLTRAALGFDTSLPSGIGARAVVNTDQIELLEKALRGLKGTDGVLCARNHDVSNDHAGLCQ